MAGSARILTIEDDAAVRRLIVEALSGDGREVLEAPDGEAGLVAARAERPDLILLDLGLPKVHGTTVLDALKHDDQTHDIPVIIVSAWGESTTARIARRRGAADVIPKPFEVADLVARVEAHLP